MTPTDVLDVSDPRLYYEDTWYSHFARLRHEGPVHYTPASPFGAYWSVVKYDPLVEVELNPAVFSSSWEYGGITVADLPPGKERRSFIRIDPPEHTQQRKATMPAVSPDNLAKMEALIRERTIQVLDGLPRNEEFNWVDRVSRELTSRMIATLFGCPLEDRHKLLRWAEIVNTNVNGPDALVRSEEERHQELLRFTQYIDDVWADRARRPLAFDIISILAHGELNSTMTFADRMGNLTLFLAGGNDTTHISMSGGIWAFSQHPGELQKLRDNPALVPRAVSEIIRWVTPVIHMRRTATQDVELAGRSIRRGDKVVLWYISANRDEDVIKDPDQLVIDRTRPRQHLSFGVGIHRCIGARLAELQLRILWEEILRRDLQIEVLDRPTFGYSNFLRSIWKLPTRIAG